MLNSLKPGGIAAVEDIDVSGAFCYPDNPHFRRCIELYSSVVRRKGGGPGYRPQVAKSATPGRL